MNQISDSLGIPLDSFFKLDALAIRLLPTRRNRWSMTTLPSSPAVRRAATGDADAIADL
jgi:hypothetical protein